MISAVDFCIRFGCSYQNKTLFLNDFRDFAFFKKRSDCGNPRRAFRTNVKSGNHYSIVKMLCQAFFEFFAKQTFIGQTRRKPKGANNEL